MDILLIIDRSGSMDDNGKLQSAKNAINGYGGNDGLIDIVESNQNIDAQYAVVSFSSNGYIYNVDGPAGASKTELNWNGNVDTVKAAVSNIEAEGGTNYQSGIRLGKTVLNSARSDAQKIVIFLTDGIPTYRLTSSGNGENGSGRDDTGNYNINAAIGEIKGMSCNAFYAVVLVESSPVLRGILQLALQEVTYINYAPMWDRIQVHHQLAEAMRQQVQISCMKYLEK